MVGAQESSVRYKRESGTYSDHSIVGDSSWKIFGHGTKITPSLKNNINTSLGLGGRQPTQLTPLGFDGSVDIEFQLGNPWWLRPLIGNAGTKIGAGPYTYYWLDSANENATGAVTLPNSVPALTIENGINLATDSVRLYKGAVVRSASISAAVEGVVDVKLNCPFRTLSKGSAGIASQVDDTFDVLTFAHGALKLPTGTTLASVQNVSLDITNEGNLQKGLGSRFASVQYVTSLKTSLKASMYFVADADILDYMLGSTTAPTTPSETTLDLIFDNGLATTNQRTVEFKFTGVKIDEDTLAQAIENPLIEEFVPIAKTLTLVKAITNTSTEP